MKIFTSALAESSEINENFLSFNGLILALLLQKKAKGLKGGFANGLMTLKFCLNYTQRN